MRGHYRKLRVTSQHLFHFFLNIFPDRQVAKAAKGEKLFFILILLSVLRAGGGRAAAVFYPNRGGRGEFVTRFLVSPA
jgi:hypothetical protein